MRLRQLFAHDGVAVLDIVVAEGTVAEVTEVDLADERQVLLRPCGIVEVVRVGLAGSDDRGVDAVDDILYWVVAVGAEAVNILFSRWLV